MTEASTPRKRRRTGRARSGGGSVKARRKAARLAAVQALYQIDVNGTPINGKSVEAVLIEFIEHRLGAPVDEAEDQTLVAADPQLFSDIVRGACHRREQVDGLAAAALDPRHALERLEAPLRAILRAGAFELSSDMTTPTAILISEYVDVAHAFYAGREPGMVNGVLDRVAKTVRAGGVEPALGADDDEDDDSDDE